MIDRGSLRTSAALLLVGQLMYIGVTQLHTGGDANHHVSIFAGYAGSGVWTAVHLGQFVAMAVLLAGLLALLFALDAHAGTARWAGRFGAASTLAALVLYGVLQAVDGVALKQAVNAWVSAPDPEKAARFASAETIRWLEWGVRSYYGFALGLALLLLSAVVVRVVWLPRPLAYLIGLSGFTYLVQAWIVANEGFSQAETIAIVMVFILDLMWMIWLVVIAWRMQDSKRLSRDEGVAGPAVV